MGYYVRIKNRIVGPFSSENLQAMIGKGTLLPEHEISEDKKHWEIAANISALFPSLRKEGISESPSKDEDVDKGYRMIPEEDMPLENTLPGPREQFSLRKLISSLWDPTGAALAFCNMDISRKNLIMFGILFFSISCLFLFVGLHGFITDTNFVKSVVSHASYGMIKTLFVSFVLLASLIVAMTLVVKALQGQRTKGVFTNSILLSGIAFLPVAFSLFISSVLLKTGLLTEVQIIILTIGLMFYAFPCAVLVLYDSCIYIGGIGRPGNVFIVAALLVFSFTISGIVFRLLLM